MSHEPQRTLILTRREVPFVDREEEFSLLNTLAQEMNNGTGQVVFVRGEGGIGKTRLVYELGRRARNQGTIFAVGTSYEEEILFPYSSWIEIMRTVARQTLQETFSKLQGGVLAEVGRLVPELAMKAKELGIKGWLTGPEMGEMIVAAEAQRVRLFQSVTDFLIHCSLRQPLILFFDDIQWADATTLQLLHYFCRRIREEKIMLIAAYRDTELSEDSSLSHLLLDLNRERNLKQIKLNRLTADHVGEVISHQLGGGRVDPELAKLIYSKTGGNPFFVEEILHSLAEQGQISKSERGWSLHEMGQVQIPTTVRALIKQRILRLRGPALQTLQVGAVIGTDFGYELLSKITAQEEEQLIQQIEEAAHVGLIKEKHGLKEVSYIFADDQIREFLYSDLSLIRRRKLHMKVAESMEKLYEDEKERHLEDLANHYIQGGDESKAIEYSQMAGDRALKLYAPREAKRHYSSVLDLLGEGQDDKRLAVLMKIGEASFRLGAFEECVKYYSETIAIAKRTGKNRETARIYELLGLAHRLFGNDREGALKCFKEGLNALAGVEDTVEEAAISQSIGRLLVLTGDVESALNWVEKSIQIARSLNAHAVLAQGLQTLALGLLPSRENKAEILGLLEESLSISVQNQLEDPTCRGYINLGSFYHHVKGDYERTKEVYLKGVEYSRIVGYLNYEAFAEAELALYAYIPLGEWDKAMEAASHSLRVGSEMGELYSSKGLTPLALANLYKGNTEVAEEYLTRAYPLAEKSQWTEIIYCCCLALGELYLRKNNLEKAEQHLIRGSEVGLWGPPIEAYFELVNLYCIKGDVAKAHELCGKLKGGADQFDEKWAYAYERWAYGLVASKEKDWNAAKEAFKKSADMWTELKHPYNNAKTTLAYGGALSESGNQSEGEKFLAEARQTFSRLGAKLNLA